MNEQATLPATRQQSPAVTPFARLRDEIDRLFDDFTFPRPARSIFAFPAQAELAPVMDLTATEDGYRITAELPGVDTKDVDVEFADGVLTLSGEKREDSERKEDGYLVSERRYGSFRRQQTLPSDIDPDSISAKARDGVLTIEMKKDKAAKNRAKKIKVG